MTYLGMQIMVEGLALAAFGFMHRSRTEPLLKQLLRYVMSDEARHVAFGVLSLKEYYAELTAAEIRERQEFAFEAAVRMRDRFMQQEVWERMGLDPREVPAAAHRQPQPPALPADAVHQDRAQLQEAGPARRNDGWLRTRFRLGGWLRTRSSAELGVIQFEDWSPTPGRPRRVRRVRPRRLWSWPAPPARAPCSPTPSASSSSGWCAPPSTCRSSPGPPPTTPPTAST
jgi:hypothetical protein